MSEYDTLPDKIPDKDIDVIFHLAWAGVSGEMQSNLELQLYNIYHLPDDPKVLKEIILDTNPNYVINEEWFKIYAHVPK